MKNKIDWNIGCSGFSYKEWKNSFYQGLPSNKWFAAYCQHFNTLETNVTFYRLPALSSLLKWYDTSPDDFSFSVKAPQLITHYKKFVNVSNELTSFYSFIQDGFKEKLACVLFQFPPGFVFSEERLQNILASLSTSFLNVVEFRHASWWQQKVFDQLYARQIVFCNISHPSLPDTIIETAPCYYFRFHGVPELYKSSYAENYLDNIINTVRHKKSSSVFLYFNNTMNEAAIYNAGYLKKITAL